MLLYLLLMALFVTRLRAEFGLPMHNLAFLGPDGPLVGIFGGYALGQTGLTALSALYSVTRSQAARHLPTPRRSRSYWSEVSLPWV